MARIYIDYDICKMNEMDYTKEIKGKITITIYVTFIDHLGIVLVF